jgi:hypothetical protein
MALYLVTRLHSVDRAVEVTSSSTATVPQRSGWGRLLRKKRRRGHGPTTCSGDYFVCLKRATPENIARKGWLAAGIEELLDKPHPQDDSWCHQLVSLVNELDDLERPFARYDRIRFGAPSSRERRVDAVRRQYLS